jgi:uncharacterized protein involved in exopolysaccharide biosynthesis
MDQLGATLRENVRLILQIGAAVFTAVMVATLLSRMEFRSAARLYLGDLNAKAPTSGRTRLDIGSGAGAGDVGSEVEILKSRSSYRVRFSALA